MDGANFKASNVTKVSLHATSFIAYNPKVLFYNFIFGKRKFTSMRKATNMASHSTIETNSYSSYM